jgi:hypothetical protein
MIMPWGLYMLQCMYKTAWGLSAAAAVMAAVASLLVTSCPLLVLVYVWEQAERTAFLAAREHSRAPVAQIG